MKEKRKNPYASLELGAITAPNGKPKSSPKATKTGTKSDLRTGGNK
jgi:hypothetical protein